MNPVPFVVIGAIVMLLTFGVIYFVRTFKAEKQRWEALPEDDSDITQPPVDHTRCIRVSVVDCHCCAKSPGKYMHEYFTVVFETDTHETLEYNVPEEMYHCFETGQRGMLTVVDDYVYGFELDEHDDTL